MSVKGLYLKTPKLINELIDNLKKCNVPSDFKYCFRFCLSTADLVTVVSETLASAFNRSGDN